jgi:hypothetical protein
METAIAILSVVLGTIAVAWSGFMEWAEKPASNGFMLVVLVIALLKFGDLHRQIEAVPHGLLEKLRAEKLRAGRPSQVDEY